MKVNKRAAQFGCETPEQLNFRRYYEKSQANVNRSWNNPARDQRASRRHLRRFMRRWEAGE